MSWGKNVPVYSVSSLGKEITKDSPLGLILKDGTALNQNFEILGHKYTDKDESYVVVVGKKKNIRNHYKQMTISLVSTSNPSYYLNLIFRAYDDGVAFRYELPPQVAINEYAIRQEFTGFNFTSDHTAWVLPLKNYKTDYEANYSKSLVSKIDAGILIALPLTLEDNNGLCFAITEANLKNYSGMYLQPDNNEPLLLRCSLSPSHQDSTIKVIRKTEIT